MNDDSINLAAVSQPSFIYDDEPVDRLSFRMDGLSALSVVAQCATDSSNGPPSADVWNRLWTMVGLIAQDMHRDVVELYQERKAETP